MGTWSLVEELLGGKVVGSDLREYGVYQVIWQHRDLPVFLLVRRLLIFFRMFDVILGFLEPFLELPDNGLVGLPDVQVPLYKRVDYLVNSAVGFLFVLLPCCWREPLAPGREARLGVFTACLCLRARSMTRNRSLEKALRVLLICFLLAIPAWLLLCARTFSILTFVNIFPDFAG